MRTASNSRWNGYADTISIEAFSPLFAIGPTLQAVRLCAPAEPESPRKKRNVFWSLLEAGGHMRDFLIAASIIFGSVPAIAQNVTVAKTQFEAWKACVTEKAQRYSKGMDSAEVVARAAMLACRSEKTKFLDQMVVEKVEIGVRNILMDTLEKTLIEDMTVLVMELRITK
jgi:hypothetical protein